MTEPTGPVPDMMSRLAEVRATGAAADGLVSVELDGSGAMRDLVIQPKAKRMASADLAAAVREAYAGARAGVQERLAESPPVFTPDLGQVGETLDYLDTDARRRLSELTSIAEELSGRLDRLS